MKLRCITVDDESLARKLLEENIRSIPFLEHIKSCKNAFEAMEVLQQKTVDLMFLDIQMPGMLGTHLLKGLTQKPLVIFVTAYDNYAVESYELEVVDYLLKPVSLERFTRAAYKALEQHRLRNLDLEPYSKVQAKENPVSPATDYRPTTMDHFFVNVEYALVKVVVSDITHVESMKDYVKIFLTKRPKPIITKATLKSIEEKLIQHGFFRAHKSYIVCLDKIESIRNHQVSIGDHEIPVSEANMGELMERLGYEK